MTNRIKKTLLILALILILLSVFYFTPTLSAPVIIFIGIVAGALILIKK